MNLNRKTENSIVGALLLVLLAVFTVVVFKTENSFGGGDHFNHYKLARWGWVYPDMLFSHWGKPAFTLLISPFAQLGIDSVRIFNIVLGLTTAWLIWLLAKHFRFKLSLAVVILVLFTPVYFILMFTSLTEVTFSFCLVLSIYFFFKEKYIWSAVVLSFLPEVRTEGIVLFPLFIVAYSLKRQWLAIPLLSIGFFLISFLGSRYYDSFWWLITEIPYTGSAKEIYGSGSLFHFVNHNYQILGTFLGILSLLGLFVVLVKWIKTDSCKLDDRFYFLLLIAGSFVVFFAAHSYVWWKGIGNSLGLIRIIGSTTPLAALTAMAGIDFVYGYRTGVWRGIVSFALLVALIFFVFDGINKHSYGFKLSKPQLIIGEAADYLTANSLDKHKIYYYNVYLAHKMNLDPRDRSISQEQLPRNETFLNAVPDSSIIVWDAHFGPNEGRMPLQNLMDKKELRVLKIFKPEKNFKVLGGHDYQVVIFQKDLSLKPKLREVYLDFENSSQSTEEMAFKGSRSFKLESHKSYKTLLDAIYNEVSDTLCKTRIQVDFAFNHPEVLVANKMKLVCSLESDDDVHFYETRDIFTEGSMNNHWIEGSFSIDLPVPETLNDRIKIYIWNKDNRVVYIDEVRIDLLPFSRFFHRDS